MNKNIRFFDEEHEEFFIKKMNEVTNDSYHKSLVYLLGLTKDTRNNFNKLTGYDEGDFKPYSLFIKPQNMNDPWQTSTTYMITHLAYNLFNGYAFEWEKNVEGADIKVVSREYTPYFLFCNKYAPFFVQAIMIRYQEYFRIAELII